MNEHAWWLATLLASVGVANTAEAGARIEAPVAVADEVPATAPIVAPPEAAPAAVPSPAPVPAPAPAPAPAAATPETPPIVESPYKLVPFDIGLVPGLSINGRHEGKRVRNKFSIGLGWTRAARVDGIAAGLGATVVDEQMQGIAVSLGANINRGTHRGVQVTQGYNFAAELRGIQSGLINRAGNARGLQIGLINIGGHVRGAQIGLVNWAKSADASFALLPVTRDGGIRFEVTSSDTALLNVGIRLPARHTYAFVGAGIHPFGTERGHTGTNLERGKAWEFGGGFGGHIPINDEVFIDIDLSGWGVTSGLRAGAGMGGLGKARLMVGWQAAPRIAVFGGPTLNVLVDRALDPIVPLGSNVGVRLGRVERPGYGWVTSAHEFDEVRVRAWPGFVAGVRF